MIASMLQQAWHWHATAIWLLRKYPNAAMFWSLYSIGWSLLKRISTDAREAGGSSVARWIGCTGAAIILALQPPAAAAVAVWPRIRAAAGWLLRAPFRVAAAVLRLSGQVGGFLVGELFCLPALALESPKGAWVALLDDLDCVRLYGSMVRRAIALTWATLTTEWPDFSRTVSEMLQVHTEHRAGLLQRPSEPASVQPGTMLTTIGPKWFGQREQPWHFS